jgi:heterodisulfide reductase subunit B
MKKKILVPLNNFRVAPFYVCHYFSCHTKKTDDNLARESRVLEKLIQATGAQNVEYPGKMQCCGAGEGIKSASNALSHEITRQKIRNIAEANVNCIVDICPFCHLQLDRDAILTWANRDSL